MPSIAILMRVVLSALLLLAASGCGGRDDFNPEALIEQQPSGAGPAPEVADELASRPTYFRKLP